MQETLEKRITIGYGAVLALLGVIALMSYRSITTQSLEDNLLGVAPSYHAETADFAITSIRCLRSRLKSQKSESLSTSLRLSVDRPTCIQAIC